MILREKTEWVSLRRAAEILGVHPATVRNWADSGKLSFRRTAGNHRRFDMNVLQQYAQSQAEIRPNELEMMVYNAVGRARIDLGTGRLEGAAWCLALSEPSRARLRVMGRRVLESITAHLLAGAPEENLSEAFDIGKEFASHLMEDELSLQQALGGWVWYCDTVMNSILTYSEIRQPENNAEWSMLMRQFNMFMHTVMMSIVEYYDAE